MLTKEEENLHSRTIWKSFFAIVEEIKAISCKVDEVRLLKDQLESWEKLDQELKPKKRRLKFIEQQISLIYQKYLTRKVLAKFCSRIIKPLKKIEFASDVMISANLRLVISNAKNHQNRGLPMDDLVQEGNIGLMRAVYRFDYAKGNSFSQAGAKSLVISLWAVPDRETKELMENFYLNIFSKKMSKSKALHEATLKQKQIVKERYGHTNPYYWGGFILTGDPGNITVQVQ